MPHHSWGTERMPERGSQTLSHCLSAYGWHSNLSPLFPKFHLFPTVTGPQETEAARISCHPNPALSHNCVNLVTSGVLSPHLEDEVAPRPHTFLLISGWCCVTRGVGSNNHMELLMLPWIPSGGKQIIPPGMGSSGEVGTCYTKARPKSICPYLRTSLHPWNLS